MESESKEQMSYRVEERGMEEDEDRRRQRRLEEAMEVKSLRRIISAYLKCVYLLFIYFFYFLFINKMFWLIWLIEFSYPEASEEDVRRYERSFKKLPPHHKVYLFLFILKNALNFYSVFVVQLIKLF